MTVEHIKEYFDKNGRNSMVFETVDSTNTYLKKNRQAEKTIALALCQTAGHGQYERVFESPVSGLYISVCEAYIPDFPMTLAAANAVLITLSEMFSLDCRVKWVNDIIAENKKLCGILAESVFGIGEAFTVIGFGMNLKKGKLSDGLSNIAVSLEELLERELSEDVLPMLALKIADNLEKELSDTKENVISRYRAKCLTEIPDNAIFI